MAEIYVQESDQHIWVKHIFINLTYGYGETYFQESDQHIWVKHMFGNLAQTKSNMRDELGI